ncbi:twin-arginine translocase subunit TatC [Riemerella anatipestifer]|uniref:Sec-independent protein translocase protein TatC n=1 Tax=Riemerella anatipestifer TaxID=34085 RepID=A0A1S7DVF4_RIEAN|nr:twin-arginine translocase subunit TatC [Riemerella anatipestifer]AQY23089.1 Sec-independent protein translocase protein TatCy [Riemerella anatipestifer]MCO4304047.1 twin-arginine translocase subunit TatC [Riemerella anatipestifer]MCO7352860.1 twin-arginine translocase subunit TatC [Riemerella anatipestifer]MCQ4039797.1 twin-arginine translocase subunit TatC [Riemerella anatipestifer]MCT6761059.1 twin-arginine translocase subunit TatC [Riemerella anatipestifer]
MSEEKEMSFLGHIGELRGHLVRSIIAIVVGGFLIGFNINWIMDHIIFGPTRPDFLTFRVVNYFSRMFVGEDVIVMPHSFPIQVRRLFEQFNMMMAVSVVGGLIIAFPYVIWELWKFISPALKESERKNSIFIINGTWVLFVMGALSGYFLVMPFVINFGYFFSISDFVRVDIDLSSYVTILLQVVLGMAVIFLFPMIVYILTSIGVLTPIFLRTYRRHAIVVIMVVAAFITPADIISMLAAAFPLVVLYEICILMSALVYRRIVKEQKIAN